MPLHFLGSLLTTTAVPWGYKNKQNIMAGGGCACVCVYVVGVVVVVCVRVVVVVVVVCVCGGGGVVVGTHVHDIIDDFVV